MAGNCFTLGTCALSTLHFALWPGPGLVASAQTLARKSFGGDILTLPLVIPPVATGLILLNSLADVVHRRISVSKFSSRYRFHLARRGHCRGGDVVSILVRAARVGFESVDVHLEEIALTLGAGPFRNFFTVTLPLAARAISAGIILAFARAVGEFGATIFLAGNIPGRTTTISLKIYEAVILGQDATA